MGMNVTKNDFDNIYICDDSDGDNDNNNNCFYYFCAQLLGLCEISYGFTVL